MKQPIRGDGMENPYFSREYLMIEADKSIHELKLAFIKNRDPEEISAAIIKIKYIKMNLLHTPAACGHEGNRGIPDGNLDELKRITIEQINNEPDSLIS